MPADNRIATLNPRWELRNEAFLVRASGEGSHHFRLCRTVAEVRAAYAALVCGEDDEHHREEIDGFMAYFEDGDNWSVGGFEFPLYCAKVEVWIVPLQALASENAATESIEPWVLASLERIASDYQARSEKLAEQGDYNCQFPEAEASAVRIALRALKNTAAPQSAPNVETAGVPMGDPHPCDVSRAERTASASEAPTRLFVRLKDICGGTVTATTYPFPDGEQYVPLSEVVEGEKRGWRAALQSPAAAPWFDAGAVEMAAQVLEHIGGPSNEMVAGDLRAMLHRAASPRPQAEEKSGG